MRPVFKFLAAFLIIFLILPITFYAGLAYWEAHKIATFCKEVQPGATFETLRTLAEKHGIGINWVRPPGFFNEREKVWIFLVPLATTFGDVNCVIRYNNDGVVLSAKMGDGS